MRGILWVISVVLVTAFLTSPIFFNGAYAGLNDCAPGICSGCFVLRPTAPPPACGYEPVEDCSLNYHSCLNGECTTTCSIACGAECETNYLSGCTATGQCSNGVWYTRTHSCASDCKCSYGSWVLESCTQAVNNCNADCDDPSDCKATTQCSGTIYQTRVPDCRPNWKPYNPCGCDYGTWTDSTCSQSVTNCGAGCDGDNDCSADGMYCSGTVSQNRDYYCDLTSSVCSCTYSVVSSENCATKLSEDSGDSGNDPLDFGSCVDYTTCIGAGVCTSTTYDDVCGSATQLTERYASGSSCLTASYDCSDYEVVATGDIADDPTTTGSCTAGTGAGCSAGIFSTNTGTGSGTESCIDPLDCPGGGNCVFREYYAIDSADFCAGLDSCASKTYDPDTNQNTCESCIGAGKWNIGGDEPFGNCCEDDNGEYVRTRDCEDIYACTSDSNDDACCDDTTDCVWIDTCYNNDADHPVNAGVKCVNGMWSNNVPPTTSILPNGGNYSGTNETAFTLTCDPGLGAPCANSYYKIIDDGEVCGTTGFTTGTSGDVTCPFGQTCSQRVCFYSENEKGLQGDMNMSEVFYHETNACQGKSCGEACLYTNGICDADNGNCYTGGGCLLDCTIPYEGDGNTRVWDNSICGRAGSYKCGDYSICANSFASCTTGGASTLITGDWGTYAYPTGSYAVGDTFEISLTGITSSEAAFSILSECGVTKANDNGAIYFDNWGDGTATFQYTIQETDPEGLWNVTSCQLWTDFSANGGWLLKDNSSEYEFIVDKTSPSIYINDPDQNDIYNANFTVNATVLDAWSGVMNVFYRWENTTTNGTWGSFTKVGNDYIAEFDVSLVSDGMYSIRVWASDYVSNTVEAVVTDITLDRQPPEITINEPTEKWYSSDFTVSADVTDNINVNTVQYRWENATDSGPWASMILMGLEYESVVPFDVNSISSGNYTITVFANDSMGNSATESVDMGIDHDNPSSSIYEPVQNEIIMGTVFNLSWSGTDAHSGVDCYQIIYEYCPEGQVPGDVECSGEINLFPGQCTYGNPPYEFDAQVKTGIEELDGYGFWFRSKAFDKAGNQEYETTWDTNVSIYIPKLITFDLTDNRTNNGIRNGGKVATNRTVILSVHALDDVLDNLNLEICHYEHVVGQSPPMDKNMWNCSARCENVRECNTSITTYVTESEDRKQVSYFLFAENASDVGMYEYLPPGAPSNYFYYTVYHHYLSNFLIKDTLRTILGASSIVEIEVRNIQYGFDTVELEILPENLVKFVETGTQYLNVSLNPLEEKTVYARLIPQSDNFKITLIANSNLDVTLLPDTDSIDIIVGFPADFPSLNLLGVIIFTLVAAFVFLKFVNIED